MKNDILNPKVLVRCMTYNHEKYIEDALNGFIIQKTDFPFTVAIVDDASTDNNVTVIKEFISKNCNRTKNYIEEDKEYGKVIQSQVTNNPNCHFYVILLNENHYSDPNKRALRHFYYKFIENRAKYIAMCEGDDYWTDSYKLQKQVDYMEVHPECSICINQVQAVTRTNEKIGWLIPNDGILGKGDFTLGDFCCLEWKGMQWTFHTCGEMYRAESLIGYENDAIMKMFPYGDMPLLLYCLLHGNGYYIPEIMSCYRVDSGGYNSTMAANPDKNIQDERKLAVALRAFDEYTNKKYHKYIQQRIRLCEYREYTLGKKHHWRIIMPQYWRCLPGKTARQKTLSAIEIIAPNMRKRLKQMKNAIVHS